jgi:FkbH-like protein
MLSDLGWLPRAPQDFRAQANALREQASSQPDGFAERLMALSVHQLDDVQLTKLARMTPLIPPDQRKCLAPVKLGLIGDGSLSLLPQALIGSGLRHGLLVAVTEGSYNGAVLESHDQNSAIRQAGLDMVLLALDHRLAGFSAAASSPAAATNLIDAALDRVRLIVRTLRPSVKGAILVQTVVPPLEPLFGSFDRVEPSSVFAMTDAFNRQLAEWAATGEIVLVDVARLAASVGYERWDDPRHWHASKIAFAPEFIPVYADVVSRILAAILGKSKKALVLDLDNTLWGGVIGDDGVEGILLGQGSATGEAFIAIQRMAIELRQRGIVLAICSKNEKDAALAPFITHPEMLLKQSDITVFQANWTDKAANLRLIAETLNIGVDALVLLDDNPAERAQVRRSLPMVGVPELPDDPAYYPRMLASAGYFEAVSLSDEDRSRADYYSANLKRAATLSASDDMDTYLKSQNMVCTIRNFDPVSRPRVTQLVNKSNQFNLTTRRYTETEIAATESDTTRHAIHVRLVDRFGDNGIISVVIVNKDRHLWEIETWLMSCRVLGRRVEEAVLAHLMGAARADGATRLVGRYIPSAKNRLVREHYRTLGFEPISEDAGGVTVWQYDIASYVNPDLPMQVIDQAGRQQVIHS